MHVFEALQLGDILSNDTDDAICLRYHIAAFLNIGLNSFSAGIVFIRQNLTSVDVRFWRIKTVG